MQNSILVVEDEQAIRELLQYHLEKDGYIVSTCSSGEEAIELISIHQPTLIILDIMLPGISGLEVCRRIKEDDLLSKIYVVMLSALGEEADVITGLEIGADGYLAKPFSPKLLLARIKSVLRRRKVSAISFTEDVSIHGISICPDRFEVKAGDEKIELTATEFKILNFLVRYPGLVFTRDKIVDSVKGTDYPVTARSVDVQIVGLRKKLGEFGPMIETIRGIGYRVRE